MPTLTTTTNGGRDVLQGQRMDAEQGGVGGSPSALPERVLRRRRRPAVNQASSLQRSNVEASSSGALVLESSLRNALAANRSFQCAVLTELARINEHKAKNRAEAVALRSKLNERRRRQQGWHATVVISQPVSPNAPYFSESDGVDVPEPNPDAVQRASLEDSTVLASKHPPWSSKESKALQKVIQQQHQRNPNQPINYEHAALRLASSVSHGKHGYPTKQSQQQEEEQRQQSQQEEEQQQSQQEEEELSSTALLVVPRTARACELHHKFSLQRRAAWTHAESKKLLELAHGREDSWPDVVADFNTHFSSRTRTVWECFTHFQTKLRSPMVQWSLPQDQLLLRYVAATGPQCVWNSPNCDASTRLSTTLLEDKTRLQILHRLHLSLCNPKLSNEPWTADEERKLVVCLKIYHDSVPATTAGDSRATANDNDDDPQLASARVSRVLNVIAAHHFPHRSTKAVVDKWKKSLDPGHSSLPFTEQEDARLVEIASSFPELGWAELCRQYFPTRHPERVAKRWVEVASNQQILNRERIVTASGGDASAVVGAGPKKRRRISRGQTASPLDNEDEGTSNDASNTSRQRTRRRKLN